MSEERKREINHQIAELEYEHRNLKTELCKAADSYTEMANKLKAFAEVRAGTTPDRTFARNIKILDTEGLVKRVDRFQQIRDDLKRCYGDRERLYPGWIGTV